MSTPTSKRPVFCADCQHSKALHYPNDHHACVLECHCRRFVSQAEAQEIARALKAQLAEAVAQ